MVNKVKRIKLFLAGGIANVFEWYDYALFGHVAALLGAKFFPASDPDVAILRAFSVFAVGYLMRPLGGIVFGIIGDKHGRKVALSLSVLCMAFPTVAIGLLPTYSQIGVTATIMMIIARMLQGFSMGGALTGSVSFMIEHAPKKHRGFVGSISMSGICVGILLGSIVASLTRALMPHEQFDAWGWRLPFLIGIIILFAGLYIRKYVAETPVFEEVREAGHMAQFPLRTVLSQHWFDMLMSIFINSTGSVIFYIQTIYATSFFVMQRNFSESTVSYVINACYIIMAVTTLFSGWLSDIIGRRRIFAVNIVFIVLCAPFLMQVFSTGSLFAVIIAQLLLSVMASVYIGPEPALQAAFYPANIRNTALSIAYNMATSLFGGTAPYVVTYLTHRNNGSMSSCAWYIITCSLLSLIGLYFYKDRSEET